MRLYLAQHGEAVPKEEDAERPLTEEGRASVSRVAAFARQAGVEVYQIRHSGKLRAEQTALILASEMNPTAGVVALPGLAPRDDVYLVAELLNRETRPLMFVGHRPFMDRLAGLLLTGDPERQVVRFEKGGIVCMERDAARWTWSLCWAVTPEMIC